MFLSGCSHVEKTSVVSTKQTATTETAQLTDEQKIRLLRDEAHKHHLQWRIFCVYWDEKDKFNASAWHPGYDDDQHDRWIIEAPTQADAAFLLSVSILGAPTHPAQPKEQTRDFKAEQKRKMCPPALNGGP
jgi:hypothetical protein